MAPKGKQTSFEIRQLVVKHSCEGKTVREIAKLVGRSSSTVQNIIGRYRNENRITNKSREGQGKILNDREERRILKEVNKNPFKTAKELNVFVKESLKKDVCNETIKNVLRRHGLNGRIARKKPLTSRKNKEVRLKFAKEYLLKNSDFWNTVREQQ